jgi:hypothetical protein
MTLRTVLGDSYPLAEGAADAAVDYLYEVLNIPKEGSIDYATAEKLRKAVVATIIFLQVSIQVNFPVSTKQAEAPKPGPNS